MISVHSQPFLADVNALLVCDIRPAVPLSLPIAEQVELIFSRAVVVQSNRNMARLCGYSQPGEMAGTSLVEVLRHNGGKEREQVIAEMGARLSQAAQSDYQRESLSAQWHYSGRDYHFQVSYHGVVNAGRLEQLVVLNHDETERRRQESLVFDIAQALAREGERDYSARLAQQLACHLSVDTILIGELLEAEVEQRIRTVALWSDGALRDNIEYAASATPCAAVRGREVCFFPERVAERFPQDEMLVQMGAQAYMGVPLYGVHGEQTGILIAVHRQAFPDEQLARSLLTIFSVSAASELDRLSRERASRMRSARQHVFFDQAPNGMYVAEVDPPMPAGLSMSRQVRWLIDHGRFVECNAAFARLLGRSDPDELLGKSFLETDTEYDLAGSLRALIGAEYELRDHAIKSIDAEGRERWMAITVSTVSNTEGLCQLLAVISDITERMLYTRQMEYRARHDSLTGLPNRAYFYESVDSCIEQGDRALAVFLLDLDGFKEVNDTLGHEMGDHLLREIGPRLDQVVSDSGAMVARLGGDEFAVMLPDYREFEHVRALGDAIMHAIRHPFRVRDLDLTVGASMGIALYPEQGETVSALMRCADIAMYQAKRHSRQIEVYRSDLDHYTVRRLALMMEIRGAIDNDELRLVYQPIVELRSGRVLGFEALLRWQHPEHGLLPPGEFIPLIELTDMIEPMTWWVLRTATRALCAWREQGLDFHLSVNISTRNIADSGFAERVKELLLERGLEGRNLILEITESALMADPEHARRVLQSLARAGVRFSIDDYGTGYSSLAYLRSLPIHTLKIDRTFISQMLSSQQDHIIVTSTVQLAHNLGLEVTAEGIENNAVLAELRSLGCDRGQGFFIARPLAEPDIGHWFTLHERLRRNSQDSGAVEGWGEGI